VPHFGEDNDVKLTKKNVADAEGKYKIIMDTSAPPADPPRDYFVPHFGEDSEIKATKISIANAEKTQGHKLTTDGPADPPPKNYFVPHFGEDKEIIYTKSNIAQAEVQLGHKLDVSPGPDDPPRNYFIPHFGLDSDVADSIKNLNAQEKQYGKWDLPEEKYFAVQLESQINREPLLTWAPTPKNTYPMDYFVPNFGEDHDISSTKGHESAAATNLKHVWTPTKDEDGNWELPTATPEFRLVQAHN